MQNERLAIPQSALNIPLWNWPRVARVDNVFGDRNPVLMLTNIFRKWLLK